MPLTRTKLRSRARQLTNDYVARKKSTGVIHLRTALCIYATIEFLAVASSAYFASAFYHFITFNSLQAKPAYVLAALVIATLVLAISISISQLRCLSKAIPAYIFMERYRISFACVLNFCNDSFFHAVCRSLFTWQPDLPDHQRRCCCYSYARHILFLASDCNRVKSNRGSTRRSNRRGLSLF